MAATSLSPGPAPFLQRGWIQSPGWDVFWMFSALWGAALLILGALGGQVVVVAVTLLAFERLFSVLHSWSTTYMVLFSSLFREERRARPVKFVVLPALLAAAAMGLGVYVGSAQRFPSDGALSAALWAWCLYILVFWIGHFWHFGNQDFGVLTIYRAKSGQDRWIDRRVDKLYAVTMMFLIQPIVYLEIVRTTGFSEIVHSVVSISRSVEEAVATGAVSLAIGITLAVAVFELRKPNRSLPKLLYLLVMFFHPAFLYAVGQTQERTLAFLYLFAYLWSHWFIAIGLVSRINTGYYRSRGDSPGIAIMRHAAVLGGIAGVVFLLTERHKEYLLFNTDGFRYKELLAAITPEQSLLIGLVLGFFLAEQLVHYYCDRTLFRFRDAAIRKRVAPLLIGSAARQP